MAQYIFRFLASVVSVYTFLCFLRIILTWIPTLSYSPFTRFIAKITDPYLDRFRHIKWLVMGSFDFSPAVGLCLLSLISTMLTSFSHGGSFSFGMILAMIVELAWTIASSLLGFLMIVLIVRLVMILTNHDNYGNPIVDQLDSSIRPMVYNIAKTFSAGKPISYKAALIISLVCLFVVLVFGSVLLGRLSTLIRSIPF